MRKLALAVLVSIVSSSLLAADDTRSSVSGNETYLSAHDLAAKVAQGGAGAPFYVPGTAGYQVLMIQRDATGDAEVHMELNDIIIIQHGHGQFLVGGQIKGNHTTAPGELRGGEITGAHRYDVSVGDLLLIPAGLPHKAIVNDGPFTHLAIKTQKVDAH